MKRMIDLCLAIFMQSLREVSPSECVRKALIVSNNGFSINNRKYHLNENVHLVAFGKAASSMVEGAEQQLGHHIKRGIASIPLGTKVNPGLKTVFYEGAEHNLPDQKAVETAAKIEQFVDDIKSENDIVLFLISGGGSALLPAPIPGISLEEKLQVIRLMSTRGAEIKQLNTVRIALSRLKGGKLVQKASPAKAISLIMSDIIGDPLELIASGPTVIFKEPRKDPIEVLRQLNVLDEVPKNVLKCLENRNAEKPDANVDINNVIVGNNQLMLKVMTDKFAAEGIKPVVAPASVDGDATDAAHKYFAFMRNVLKQSSDNTFIGGLNSNSLDTHFPTIFIFGGETTVNFPPCVDITQAKGGRSQEMVLAFFKKVLELQKNDKWNENTKFSFYSLGTDGQDGPTDATGAFISSEDLPKKEDLAKVLDEVEAHWKTKNSYGFWSKFNNGKNHVKIGKTGNNLMDVQLLYVDRIKL